MQEPTRPGRRSAHAPAATTHARDFTARPALLATGGAITPAAPSVRAWPWRALRKWLLVALVACAYLLPGTLGHDPWKQDETYTFGIVQHMVATGDPIVPVSAGQPFVEKPPLYAWVASTLVWLLADVLPAHDAARLASALFAGLALAFTARLARAATGAASWTDARVLGTVALCAGSLIVVKHAHEMITDVALLAGTAIGFCGLFECVQPATRARGSAWLLGIGMGMALLAKGVFIPLVFCITIAGAGVVLPACRSRVFARQLGTAALVFLPFATIWPTLFYLRAPDLFQVWFWDNNIGRFLGFSVPVLGAENDDPFYVWHSLLTIGFPAGPLALVALACGAWRDWRTPHVALPLVFAAVGLLALQVSATARPLYLLPFIVPLATLGQRAITRLPMRVHVAWDYLGRALFGTIALLTWLLWAVMTESTSHAGLRWLDRWLPVDWILPIQPTLVAAALALTVGWLWLLPRLKAAGAWRGAMSWAAGALVGWGLIGTLLLPWLDEAKSYRSVFDSLGVKLAPAWRMDDCMASLHLGESEAPMLRYFTGILHQPVGQSTAQHCRWLIVQDSHAHARTPGMEWTLFWSGARHGDRNERLRVFQREIAPPP
ncbi:ArnT family glycosyltransferase [Ralstonia flatus]|uniref:Undecaprenyl phosphate-alpha-4-amino-4-deoxy-L-arabinose arabinosyl transferase n=1 Tax=Ralstonia flatus TaxID=3058601 RepID=A0AAD2F8J6_9RALS|nr:glycosyl transferase [Ralstonia sp. LMG 32965]MBN6211756.1 glycosyl transferase [Ralstonia pickettii]CAJ0864803.1 Undecaprenyl phosphate-alpha-4-amino-4-deoxy-L-arabinose arabinosyl transferase [Ralstonia sp. LMG 32965]CAJ0872182.1 Undecaprenyl phosphate-alpha-4-amino-4-deoxy-L-arabinose arabinosyl transferase [Ralstonia sp. LMG 32965]